jgi:hypothetical protein
LADLPPSRKGVTRRQIDHRPSLGIEVDRCVPADARILVSLRGASTTVYTSPQTVVDLPTRHRRQSQGSPAWCASKWRPWQPFRGTIESGQGGATVSSSVAT